MHSNHKEWQVKEAVLLGDICGFCGLRPGHNFPTKRSYTRLGPIKTTLHSSESSYTLLVDYARIRKAQWRCWAKPRWRELGRWTQWGDSLSSQMGRHRKQWHTFIGFSLHPWKVRACWALTLAFFSAHLLYTPPSNMSMSDLSFLFCPFS